MDATQEPTTARNTPLDHRRAISRQAWLTNRARNALKRPVFIGAISIATFVTAIVSMVVVPKTQRQTRAPVPALPRPETLSIASNAALADARLVQADSALKGARTEMAAAVRTPVVDSASMIDAPHRDSLAARVGALDQAVARAEQAPLPTSYRAVADLPELRSDPRVRSLLDSLTELEREREGFGAVGGVDPVFVALTSRANEIGRVIQAIAGEYRKGMQAKLTGPPVLATSSLVPAIDTSAFAAQRDAAQQALAQATAQLTVLRAQSRDVDLEEERARERASAVAPPLALLASAFVLSAVIGFAVAFIGELRRPRVSDAQELERFLGVRVLSTVETSTPSIERGRREADRAAPPYFDPSAEGYQLAYLGLATEHPTLLMATITGDEPAITAVVACNLAAIAADEARNALLLDLDPSCNVSAALRVRAHPGLVDIARGSATWPDATIPARVGRDKTVDLVPHGIDSSVLTLDQAKALLQEGAARAARYYDAILTTMTADATAAGLPDVLPSPQVVYCARPGTTPLHQLRNQLDQIRATGGVVRGIVLWNAERPLLPTPRALSAGPRIDRPSEPRVALAPS